MAMRSFCGIMMKKNQRVDESFLNAMFSAFNSNNSSRKIKYKKFLLGVEIFPEENSGKVLPDFFEDEKYIGCYDGRIDEIIIPGQDSKRARINMKQVILSACYNPEYFLGDFAIAAYIKEEAKLVLVRDHLGVRPLYYLDHIDFIAFSTEIEALKMLPGISLSIDERWIADTISTVKSEKWRTPYEGIKRVLPGHIVTFQYETEINRYWDLAEVHVQDNVTYDEALEVFSLKLKTALDRRVNRSGKLASELSGGLDSSAITALGYKLAENNRIPFCALTNAFSDASLGKFFPYSDERDFSRAVSEHIGLADQNFCHADEFGLLDRMKSDIFIQSGPTQQNYSKFSDPLYERGKNIGVTHLLSGFGGDEGVSSTAKGFFEEITARGEWEIFKKEYFRSGILKNRGKIGRYAKYLARRYFPLAFDFIRHDRKWNEMEIKKFQGLGFDENFALRLEIEKNYFKREALLKSADVRKHQYHRIMHNHVSQRFECSYLDAKAYGIEYVYPLWDIDLISYYYSLPAEYKFRNGMGRAIFRDALLGILPDKVRLRTDKTGTTLPTVHQRFIKDYDEIIMLIQRCRSHNKYHYLNYDKMLAWQIRLKNRGFKDIIPVNQGAFLNSIQILLLQEMERTGEYKSGIRY